MFVSRALVVTGCLSTTIAAWGTAQKPPAIRQIGVVERATNQPLASVASVVPLPGGRVLVNDLAGHRVLLLDSTLSTVRVVADTTSATGNAYGRFPGTLIPFHGDSALFIDPGSVSMLVIGPDGAIRRVMAMPRPERSPGLVGGPFGMPGSDAQGRLVYFGSDFRSSLPFLRRGIRVSLDRTKPDPTRDELERHIDSAVIARVDLGSRAIDTLTVIRVPRLTRTLSTDDQGVIQAIEVVPDPLPLVDDWAMMPDGGVAVVRGRDYHIEWMGSDGRWTSSPKIAFEWQRLSDERKQALIDSAVTATRVNLDTLLRQLGGAAGAGGGRSGGIGAAAANLIPVVAGTPGLNDVPDYMPAFERGATRPDLEGNLWIRTTNLVQGRPVYDVVNRKGQLVDRVQVPPFRTIAGFGPKVVYLVVRDNVGIVHLERAREK